MDEYISFYMQVTKNIPEVMAFASDKIMTQKMEFYCKEDERAISQFRWWCETNVKINTIDGIVDIENEIYMPYNNAYIVKSLVEDIAQYVPQAEFLGVVRNFCEGWELLTISFSMKKGELSFVIDDHADDYVEEDEVSEEQMRADFAKTLSDYSDEDVKKIISGLKRDNADKNLKISPQAFLLLDNRAQCVELLLSDYYVVDDMNSGLPFDQYLYDLPSIIEEYLCEDEDDADIGDE